MRARTFGAALLIPFAGFFLVSLLPAQQPPGQPPAKEDTKRPEAQPGGGPRGPGGPGNFAGPMGQERKLVKQFDKNADGRLNTEERLAAREFIKKDRESGGGRGFGPGGMRAFSPAAQISKPLVDALDADKNGKLTRAEVATGVKSLIAECDKDKKGSLDEAQLAEGLNRIVPSPAPRGPGAGGPPPGGAGGGQPPGGPGGGPPPAGPGGPGGGFRMFRIGNGLATAILTRADVDKDAKVTPAELQAAADKLFDENDKDKDATLNEAELNAGLEALLPRPTFGPGGRGNLPPAKPGPRVDPADVVTYPKARLYEPTVLRTLFLEFESKDWEAEIADFYRSDVEVPATLTVDGKKYPNVGVHFRGASSYFGVGAGHKRSLNLALDFVNPKQRLHGYKTLNLLNSHEDDSLLTTVLYSHIARQHMPAPKANLVKLVINGESWGVYVNVQQFDRVFLDENFKTTKGARWKVMGSPGGGGGLDFIGDKVEDYKRRYEIKSGDDEKDWKALIELCRTLSQTPIDQLEAALKPMLDIDSLLWFLALDVALINNDGYWVRASDFNIYRDAKGKFHIIPHDMNESFHGAMGFGMFGGPGGPGGRGPGGPGGPAGPGGAPPPPGTPVAPPRDVLQGPGAGPGGPGMGRGPGLELDPLVGMDDARKPLRSRLLAVPSLKARYLAHVRTIAEESLDWKKLGPVVHQYRSLIEKEVEADTRKLMTFDAFKRATDDAAAPAASGPAAGRGPGLSLRAFADRRRQFLLNHAEIKKSVSLGGKVGASQ